MTLLRSIGVLWLVIGVATTNSQAGESRQELAEELVRTMKADDQVIELAEKRILSRCRDEPCDEEMRQCLFKLDRDKVMPTLVSIAERELTPAEMKAGINYFRTEIGEKHRQVMRAELGLAKASLSDQIPEERVAMLAFLDTPTGYRLVTRALLTNSDQVRGMALNLAGQAFDRCRP